MEPTFPNAEFLSLAVDALLDRLKIPGLSRGPLLAHVQETLYGEKAGWESFKMKLITDEELRNLVLARLQTFVANHFGIPPGALVDLLAPEIQDTFDHALYGRSATGES